MVHLLAVLQYVQTHVAGIVFAIVASFLIGFLWHGPLFGKKWMKFNKIPEPKPGEFTFSKMIPGFAASILMPLFQAAVLGRTFELLALAHIGHAFLIGAIIWLPFTALALANEYAWAGKSFAHTCFDAAYNLASTLAIAAVLYITL